MARRVTKNILVNGKPRGSGREVGVLVDRRVPERASRYPAAGNRRRFRGKRSTTLVNRAAFRYDSRWSNRIHTGMFMPGPVVPAEYAGAIWIDKENFRVLRIELEARNIPRDFRSILWNPHRLRLVIIGGESFLLPVHSRGAEL